MVPCEKAIFNSVNRQCDTRPIDETSAGFSCLSKHAKYFDDVQARSDDVLKRKSDGSRASWYCSDSTVEQPRCFVA
jgi:hypothetical protein